MPPRRPLSLRTPRRLTLHVVLSFLSIVALRANEPPAEPRSLFDGTSFAGWRHDDSHWSIEDGAITGTIPGGERLRRNLFLFWEGELHDFELEIQFRITGNDTANSGVQFRCQMLPDGGAAGYQADLDKGAVWAGRIYDEHGRALIAERGETVEIAEDGEREVERFRDPKSYADLVKAGWNDYRIRAVGPEIEVFLNGERTTTLVDGHLGQHDYSGKLAFQLHSGPGPAKVQFRNIRLTDLGETEPPPRPAVRTTAEREGILPVGTDGEPLDLGFESGTLGGWIAEGEAFARQPIRGDTVSVRRSEQASDHIGEYWLGGYEVAGDGPTGSLESPAFEVTHPFASLLVGGGSHPETRVEVVDAASGELIASFSGQDSENLEPRIVRLEGHVGSQIFLRIVDEHSGAWGHVNYDDFRFHEELPEALAESALPRRIRTNPILGHLRPNPASATPASTPGERTVGGMYVPPGFAVDLIAEEPRVRQPIAFTFDERGRIWVAEAYSYPQRRPEGEGKDRLVIFADEDGDGSFESRKVFTEGLNLVSGFEVGYGGVWVGASPELLFIPDRDGDDVPDSEPEVLLDGWGYQDTHETVNSFTWGPDGWLYGNHGVFNSSKVGTPGTPEEERVELYAGVWRYHPVRREFEVFARGGSNQWGLDFDEHGELFMTHCRSYWGRGPTTHVVLRGHYWNQANSRHAPFVSGKHPNGLPHLRNFMLASARYGHGEGGAGERGSRATYGGHSHVGTMIYLGDNWPEEYRGHLYTHNLHGHQINRQVNERRGAGYETVHSGHDVFYVEDPLYVGVDLDYGPDGAVYSIDWYDRQHCHSPHMESWDRSNGRIYRMHWDATYRPVQVDLRSASDLELARLHTHENAWYSRTARRILHERSARRAIGEDARAELVRMWNESEDEVLDLRVLWTLWITGTGGAYEQEAFSHEHENVRAWGVRLATERGEGLPSGDSGTLVDLAEEDPSPVVRLALASHLPDASESAAWPLAEALAAHPEDANDAYIPRMVWYGIAPHVQGDLDRAFALAESTAFPELRDWILWHVAKTGPGLDRAVAQLADSSTEESIRDLELIRFALEGRGRVTAPGSWQSVAGSLYDAKHRRVREQSEELGALFGDEHVIAKLRADLASDDVRPQRRKRAFDILERIADEESVDAFIALLDDPSYRSRVIGLLARFDDDAIPGALIDALPKLEREDRERAIRTLSRRPAFAVPFLEAIIAEEVTTDGLTSFHIRQLRNLGDEGVDALVTRVWGEARDTSEEARDRMASLARTFEEAPLWAYSANSGRQVFDTACATCHSVAGEGNDLGPDLAGAGNNGVRYFLEAILDPNAVVGEDYQLTVVILKNGTVLSGLLKEETSDTLTLRTIEETRVIPKARLLSREKQSSSMMPEGLFDDLSERQIIELLKYLTSLR